MELAYRSQGVPERVLLLSRDESSMLVVSYRDIKRCIESSFGELEQAGQQGGAGVGRGMPGGR